MADLIPFDSQTAADLEQRLSGTPFRSTDDFINFYNSGLINKTAEAVAAFAAEVDSTFKSVKLQGRVLVFISKEEVELEEAMGELRKWEILVKAKGRLTALLSEGTVQPDSVVAFTEDSVGTLHLLSTDEDGTNTYEKIVDEKFFRPADELLSQAVHTDRSSLQDQPGHFLVRDFTTLDDSFVSDIHSILFTV